MFKRMTNRTNQAGQSSQQTLGHHTTDAPPPYKLSGEAKPTANDVPSALGSSDLPKQQNVEFTFYPRTVTSSLEDIEWEAHLEVRAKDVQQLMKEGFHWNETNIREGEGYLVGETYVPADLRDVGWPLARCYSLADLAEDPQWTAKLSVGAHEMSVLSRFRVSNLSVDTITMTKAWDRQSRVVYIFCRTLPEMNCNAYYDDKPLDGWWPWPKQEQCGRDSLQERKLRGGCDM